MSSTAYKIKTSLRSQNEMKIAPYRNPPDEASLVKIKEASEIYGLLRARIKPVHRCRTPGFFYRFFLRLIGRKITIDSYFRCPCGKVYNLYKNYPDLKPNWHPTQLACWIDAHNDNTDYEVYELKA